MSSPQALGSNSRTFIQKETSFKTTPVSPAADLVYFITNGLRLSRNLISSNTIRGNRNPSKPVVGNKDVAGDITVELQAYMGRILEGTFGAVDSSTHKFTYSSNTGVFTPGETVTGSVSTETATVIYDDGVDTVYIKSPSGAFQAENLTGATSGYVAIIGGDATAIVAAPYAHRFYVSTTAGATIPSYTIERGYIDISQFFLYNGCKVNSFGFSVVPEGFQEVSVNWMGAKEAVSSSSYALANEITDRGKSSFDGFTISTLQEGGSDIAYVTTIDGLTIENNLDGSVYVIDPSNLGERHSLPEGTVKVSGTVTAVFQDLALYNKAIAEPSPTETSLKITYTLGTGAGTDGNEVLEFFIPELIFSPQAPIVEGPTGVLVSLPFECYMDDSTEATTAIHAILLNTQATI
jgi:hypothetical protein